MSCEDFSARGSPIHRVDPRVRVVATAAFAAAVVASEGPALVWLLGVAVGLAAAARLPAAGVLRRLVAPNVFLAALALVLGATTPGRALWRIGPVALSREGLLHGGAVALRCNAIVLAALALIATMTPAAFGGALRRLGVPLKLALLFLFTMRYVDVLRHESARLRRAMAVRAFRPRMTRHAYRSLGHLAGMLLVRSFDRSLRVANAMKCRGFRGEFHRLDAPRLRPGDALFGALVLAALAAALGMPWWGTIR